MGQIHELYSDFAWTLQQTKTPTTPLLEHLQHGGRAYTESSGFRYVISLSTDADSLRQARDGLADEGLAPLPPMGMVVWTVWSPLLRRVLCRYLPIEQMDSEALTARLSFVARQMHQAVLHVTRLGKSPLTTPSRPVDCTSLPSDTHRPLIALLPAHDRRVERPTGDPG